MLVRSMVEHQVHDDVDVTLVGLAEQAVEVLQVTKLWVDRVVVGNVVAEVNSQVEGLMGESQMPSIPRSCK